jgi:hypothetical protein
MDRVFKAIGNEPGIDSLENSLKDQDISKGIMGFGINLQSQIVPQVLKAVFGDCPVRVQVSSQLEGADCLLGMNLDFTVFAYIGWVPIDAK